MATGFFSFILGLFAANLFYKWMVSPWIEGKKPSLSTFLDGVVVGTLAVIFFAFAAKYFGLFQS